MTQEETTFKMTECANELYSYGDYNEVILLLQSIDRLCDHYTLDMPDEAVSLNVELDEKFQTDVLRKRFNWKSLALMAKEKEK